MFNAPKTFVLKNNTTGAYVIVSIIAFLFLEYVSDFVFKWLNNSYCPIYVGCNIGFFGLDAVQHFLSGIIEVSVIIYLAVQYRYFNILIGSFKQNILIILSITALIGASWEIIEYFYDIFRTTILNINLLEPNNLAQPNNYDTMGDISFNLFGAIIMSVIYTKKIKTINL